MNPQDPQDLLRASFDAAVAAADPLVIVPVHLPAPPRGRTLVIGAGKAAAAMALAVQRHWPADAPLDGLVITRYAHGYPADQAPARIRTVEAGHPVPDESGEAAARDIAERVRALGPDDLLIALVSGGGSSLLALPADGISMADLKAVTHELLACGAPIQDMNVVRKHLSLIQGGRLAALCRAPIVSLVISDVTGDEPTHIASGPTVPDPSTYQDAVDILARFECKVPPAITARLAAGVRGDIDETPKPGSPVFARSNAQVIATAHRSLEAAAGVFRAAGVTPVILGDTVTGEAREAAKVHAAIVREVIGHNGPFARPVALISGGECTVTLKHAGGRGGRCSEYLLSLAIEMAGADGVYGLAADTDGIDGSEANAGAWFSPQLCRDAATRGLRADKLLAANDAFGYFEAIGGLIVTGPTRTNVNDYRVVLVR